MKQIIANQKDTTVIRKLEILDYIVKDINQLGIPLDEWFLYAPTVFFDNEDELADVVDGEKFTRIKDILDSARHRVSYYDCGSIGKNEMYARITADVQFAHILVESNNANAKQKMNMYELDDLVKTSAAREWIKNKI